LNADKTDSQNKPVVFSANNLSANVPVTSKHTDDEPDATNADKTTGINGSAASVEHYIPTTIPMDIAHQLAGARTNLSSLRTTAVKASTTGISYDGSYLYYYFTSEYSGSDCNSDLANNHRPAGSAEGNNFESRSATDAPTDVPTDTANKLPTAVPTDAFTTGISCDSSYLYYYFFASEYGDSDLANNHQWTVDVMGICDRFCADFIMCEHPEYEVKLPTKKADRECRQSTSCSKDECKKTKTIEAPFATVDRTSYTTSWTNTPRTLTWTHRIFHEPTFKEPTKYLYNLATFKQYVLVQGAQYINEVMAGDNGTVKALSKWPGGEPTPSVAPTRVPTPAPTLDPAVAPGASSIGSGTDTGGSGSSASTVAPTVTKTAADGISTTLTLSVNGKTIASVAQLATGDVHLRLNVDGPDRCEDPVDQCEDMEKHCHSTLATKPVVAPPGIYTTGKDIKTYSNMVQGILRGEGKVVRTNIRHTGAIKVQ
jgi:hypothetical protein